MPTQKQNVATQQLNFKVFKFTAYYSNFHFIVFFLTLNSFHYPVKIKGGSRVDQRRWIFFQTSCLKTVKAKETRVCGGHDITCHNSINQNHVSFYTQKFNIQFIVQIVYRVLTCKNLRQLPLGKYVSKM